MAMVAGCCTDKDNTRENNMSVTDTALSMENADDAIIAIDDYLSSRFSEAPDSLTPEEKNVVYIEDLEREVNNGGFSDVGCAPHTDTDA